MASQFPWRCASGAKLLILSELVLPCCGAVLLPHQLLERVVRQRCYCIAVDPGHRFGTNHGINDRLLRRLYRGIEDGIHRPVG